MSSFVLHALFKDVSRANSFGRYKECLLLGWKTDLLPDQDNKDNVSFWGKCWAGLLATLRRLGFPRLRVSQNVQKPTIYSIHWGHLISPSGTRRAKQHDQQSHLSLSWKPSVFYEPVASYVSAYRKSMTSEPSQFLIITSLCLSFPACKMENGCLPHRVSVLMKWNNNTHTELQTSLSCLAVFS